MQYFVLDHWVVTKACDLEKYGQIYEECKIELAGKGLKVQKWDVEGIPYDLENYPSHMVLRDIGDDIFDQACW